MSNRERSDFERLFDQAAQDPAPVERAPLEQAWHEVWLAHTYGRAMEVTLVERGADGWVLANGPLRGFLRDDCGGAAAKAGACRLFVLRFDRNAGVLLMRV